MIFFLIQKTIVQASSPSKLKKFFKYLEQLVQPKQKSQFKTHWVTRVFTLLQTETTFLSVLLSPLTNPESSYTPSISSLCLEFSQQVFILCFHRFLCRVWHFRSWLDFSPSLVSWQSFWIIPTNGIWIMRIFGLSDHSDQSLFHHQGHEQFRHLWPIDITLN